MMSSTANHKPGIFRRFSIDQSEARKIFGIDGLYGPTVLFVVQKSNNLQNVTVANLRGLKEQQPSECYSRKPTWFERAKISRMLQS